MKWWSIHTVKFLILIGFLLSVNGCQKKAPVAEARSSHLSSNISTPEHPLFIRNYPQKQYHKLVSGNLVVGKTQSLWRADTTGLVFEQNSEIKLMLFHQSQTMTTREQVFTDNNLKVEKFQFEMNTEKANMLIEANRVGDVFQMKVRQAGQVQTKEIRVEDSVILGSLVHPYLLKMGLLKDSEVPVRLEIPLLEPSALTVVPTILEVRKILKNRWNVKMHYLHQTVDSDIDERGFPWVERTDLAGLSITNLPIDEATYRTMALDGTKEDLVEIAKVKFPVIHQARELEKFSVKILGVDLESFSLNRHRQSLNGEVLAIKVEDIKSGVLSLPFQSLVGHQNLDIYLQGDTMIPVYDEKVQKAAHEIVGQESDLWKRALKIHHFVYQNLEKVPTVSVPNALEVLTSKRGDCNEHSVLFTALARAAGIPTRSVAGLVYSDGFYGAPGFYYHAWVEIFTGKQWVALDPTWNQIPADATHLAFVEGGLDQQVQIIALMGKIKLQPVP